MKRVTLATVILTLVLVIAGCAPVAVKAPSPAPTASPPPTAAPARPTSTASLEEASWQKVVEAAKREGKVNAYSYSWTGDRGLSIARAFKDKYGISVEIVTGRGSEFLERMKTEKRTGQRVADMAEGSSLNGNNLRLEGLLVSFVDELPALREKGVWQVDPTAIDPKDRANLAWRLTVYTPYINTKLVKQEDIPTSWKDLLGPKWAGKMSLTEPKLGTHISEYMVVLVDNKVWDEDYVRGLYKQNLRFPTGLPDEFLALSRGEFSLMICGSDGTASAYALEGAPMQAIDMKEGVVLSTASVAAVAGGPNPNATRVFINWLFSPEGMSIAGKAQGNKMVRTDVADFRPKAVQAQMANPLLESVQQLEKSTQLFRDRWFDKVVGR